MTAIPFDMRPDKGAPLVRRVLLLVTTVLLIVNATVRAGSITKGPCLLCVSQDRAALMWETDTAGPCHLQYGLPDTAPQDVQSPGEEFKPKGRRSSDAVYIHKIWIKGLTPGRTYNYRVVGEGVASETYTFRTVPQKVEEVTFVVYGDSRSDPEHHRRVVERMIDVRPDFVVHTGDLVSNGDTYEQWGPQFFQPLRGLVERVPIHIAKGNHERNGGHFERLLIPPGQTNDFGFDFGPLHYFCADNYSDGVDDDRLLGRIVKDAQASTALWKFVSYHEPSLNFGGHDSHWKRAAALPALAGARVDFVIAGHSHLYERFRPIAPPPSGGSHVTYITSGGGGARIHDTDSSPYQVTTKSVRHFCVFRIKGNRLTMDAIDENGNVIDHFEVTKTDGRLDDRYLQRAVPMKGLLGR